MKFKIVDYIKNKLGIDKLERERIKIDARLDKLEDLSLIGVDLGVSEKSDSYIIIASKVKGGIVKIIPMAYHNPSEVLELAKGLEQRYGIREIIRDFPRGMNYF